LAFSVFLIRKAWWVCLSCEERIHSWTAWSGWISGAIDECKISWLGQYGFFSVSCKNRVVGLPELWRTAT
jgi:hypothetical protein